MRPFAGGVGPGLLRVQDNAQPSVTRVCGQFLEDDWPTMYINKDTLFSFFESCISTDNNR